ncbi:MAG: low molecular weight phosphotyrosine protein phosphatase [Firmicutes bacterium]|nr:low molecular weight phosphotyrosine protein phosphatase [Bacillota bacterium]
MINVLFVCHANKSRSPMAEGIFKKLINDSGISNDFTVESRAVSSEAIGSSPHPETIKRLEFLGIPWEDMISEKINQLDYRHFDFIICMDDQNEKYLKKHAGIYRDKVYLVRDINHQTKKQNIPDPYYTLDYDETFNLLMESLAEWVTMFKLHKLSKMIDLEAYRITNQPLFLSNPSWYTWDTEEKKYVLNHEASFDAVASYKEFYKEEDEN